MSPEPVTDIDELSEDKEYRYIHGTEAKHIFTVDLCCKNDENFADYGEGAVQFQYRDGYVSDLPVSNVKEQISDGKIVYLEPRLQR
jgi:hypothetical protein